LANDDDVCNVIEFRRDVGDTNRQAFGGGTYLRHRRRRSSIHCAADLIGRHPKTHNRANRAA
jgi:hypothetical protein